MVNDAVLFVDDDEFVLHSLRRALVQEPYPKLYAKSAFEADQQLKENGVCVVVTDIKMPVTDGVTFLADLKEKYPDIIRMVLSGYAQVTQIIQSVNRGEIYRYIAKPWSDNDELIQIINDGIAFYQKRQARHGKMVKMEKELKALGKFRKLAQELGGNVNVCRRCNKVHRRDRDDWEQLTYLLSSSTGISFSETICPACASAFRKR